MARGGRRQKGKRLEPPLPEAKAELNLPKYFKMIRGGGYSKAKEEGRISMPGFMPQGEEMPKVVNTRRSLPLGSGLPDPKPEPESIPLIIRIMRRFISIFTVEPERPVKMPTVPELNYPALYTRYPIMKTVTKTTDVNGEISVTYSHTFQTVPGVVISVKDPDNVFGTVFNTTLTGFGVRLFKMDHDHGGVVDDDGLHTPTVNADGQHSHNVQGTGTLSLDTNWGRLVLANYTDYETGHVHTQVQTQLETDHTHGNYPTSYESDHTHSFSDTSGGPSSTANAVYSLNSGCECSEACGGGYCIVDTNRHTVGSSTHTHYVSGTTGGGSQHRHTQPDTQTGTSHRHLLNNTGAQPSPGHRHLISNDDLYKHYVWDVQMSLDLVASANENPYHGHSAVEVPKHGHGVAADGRVLLKSTVVTLTYIAQEESS